jgi:predicted aconitase
MLGSLEWDLITEIQGQPVGPIFKVREANFTVKTVPIGCPKTSAANCRSMQRKVPEKRRPDLHHIVSSKLQITTKLTLSPKLVYSTRA